MSSFGSCIRFIGVCLFIRMIVERLSRKRKVMFGSFMRNSLEWSNHNPLPHHGPKDVLILIVA